MPISLDALVKDVRPKNTVLFFGAGSSVPSGCPDAKTLCSRLIGRFNVGSADLSLPELAGLIEIKTHDRRGVIDIIRASFQGKRPTKGLLTVPLFDWRCLYTTNYDELIEMSYSERNKELSVISSNFDFRPDVPVSSTRLYKLHGTVGKDRADGFQVSMIVTDKDYEDATQQREFMYGHLEAELATSDLVIIGYSLNDPEIAKLINRVVSIRERTGSGGRFFVLSYTPDEDRAAILENRNFRVAFGGIDEFFAELLRQGPDVVAVHIESSSPLDAAPALIPLCQDVNYDLNHGTSNVSALFNGRPAGYPDISAGLTFERDIASRAFEELTRGTESVLLSGASGVGKTTAARQLMARLCGISDFVWEHRTDNYVDHNLWMRVAARLAEQGKVGYLFVDEAHSHIQELSGLADLLANHKNKSLRLILAAPRNRWEPRVKSPALIKATSVFRMTQLSSAEIERLLTLAENAPAIRQLVEGTFAGFNRGERRRRLVDRCEADTFVCLKNIFASEGFDDIVLAEYAGLDQNPRDVYRVVAFLETCGVIVHRQLLIRLLGIPSGVIAALLTALTDIVFEMPVNEREGVYAWRGRHSVISSIISKYKFSDQSDFVLMLERVIGAINPAFPIELRSVRELCSVGSGIAAVASRNEQNRLLRMIISIAPGERVPRHRLIRNMIDSGDYEKAATEIRIFEKDFYLDGPVARYKVRLMISRATRSPGLLAEDRIAIMEQAISEAARAATRFSHNKMVVASYCEAGVEYFKLTGDSSVFDTAIDLLKKAEETIGDPDISRMVARFEARFSAGVEADEDGGSVDDDAEEASLN